MGIWSIALVRFLWGLGSGVTGQLAGVAITKITPPGELPEQMQCLQFWQTLGLGMGPLIVGLAIFADGLPLAPSVQPAKLCAAPATLAILQILVLLTLFQHCPASIQAWQSSQIGQVSGVTLKPEKQPAGVQVLFLCSCFLLCALRGYAVAGAEVGTALLLETPYGWNRHSIGFLVSGTFLASIPLRWTYLRLRDRFSVATWIRILSLVAIGGTTLVFSRVTHAIPGGVILVLADAVMFPALYLGEGLTRGLMMQFAKENVIFSVNLSSFLAILLNNVARTIAPWLSRLNLSAGDDPFEGQNLFAACQLTCCIFFLGVFEVGVRHVTPARPVLVIGLPSLNEADNIEALTKVVDEGCQRYFPQHRCLLVNADCQSSDGTAAIFAQTQTRCEKVSLRTSLPAEGKGAALKLVFSCMLEVNAVHGICLDTDLKTMTPEWIRAFSLALQYDFAVPRYLRHRCDGFITNMVVYPSVCAVFGYDIRQAIGGDFGFSRRAAEAFLAQPWPAKVEKYGIDIFMTTTVLKRGYSMVEVELPPKIHSPSLPKLKDMLPEVVGILLTQLDCESFHMDLRQLPRIPWQSDKPMTIPEVKVDPAIFVNLAELCFKEHEQCILAHAPAVLDLPAAFASPLTLDAAAWVQLLHWALTTDTEREAVVRILSCCCFLRSARHCADVQERTNEEAERLVLTQRDALRHLAMKSWSCAG